MSTQAQNSLALYRGQDPNKILMLLKIQRASVVDELKAHVGASSLEDLAFRLSML
jgi:hypothetical protein